MGLGKRSKVSKKKCVPPSSDTGLLGEVLRFGQSVLVAMPALCAVKPNDEKLDNEPSPLRAVRLPMPAYGPSHREVKEENTAQREKGKSYHCLIWKRINEGRRQQQIARDSMDGRSKTGARLGKTADYQGRINWSRG